MDKRQTGGERFRFVTCTEASWEMNAPTPRRFRSSLVERGPGGCRRSMESSDFWGGWTGLKNKEQPGWGLSGAWGWWELDCSFLRVSSLQDLASGHQGHVSGCPSLHFLRRGTDMRQGGRRCQRAPALLPLLQSIQRARVNPSFWVHFLSPSAVSGTLSEGANFCHFESCIREVCGCGKLCCVCPGALLVCKMLVCDGWQLPTLLHGHPTKFPLGNRSYFG